MAQEKTKLLDRELFNIRHLWILILAMLSTAAAVILLFVFCILQYTNAKVPVEKETSGQSIAEREKEEESEVDPLHKQYGPLADIKIELTFDKKTEKLTIKEISDWVTVKKKSGKYSYTVDEEKLAEYTRKLADQYTTFQPYITFTNTSGEELELLNRSTGWIFDDEYAFVKIQSYIEEHQSVSLKLTDKSEESNHWWSRISLEYNAEKKKGKTYAEVSIDLQYLWIYKNGEVILESPVVTGNPNTGNDTPTGAFVVANKKAGAILYGPGYYTSVDYWVGFADDIGFHDASWQEEFGGEHYLTDGSHGCVNLPDAIAEQVFEISYQYMPVYVY